MTQKNSDKDLRWILFFYTVPSKPVNKRMTVWRKLVKAGAILLKGSVYILPFGEDHYEFAQWLVAEVKEMGGDAAMLAVDRIDSVTDSEVMELFRQARRSDYLPLAKGIEEITLRLNAIRKGGQGGTLKSLAVQLEKNRKVWADIRRIDFFATEEGLALGRTIGDLEQELQQLMGVSSRPAEKAKPVPQLATADYQGRVWATRSRPFVDRMATAWLITTFIDPQAEFVFFDGAKPSPPAGAVVFDASGGEFTHVGALCTFEVMVRAFGIRDQAVRRIAEIVHDLDLKDDKYQSPEGAGIEEILLGIRKTAASDEDALTQGMRVFALLHAVKKS